MINMNIEVELIPSIHWQNLKIYMYVLSSLSIKKNYIHLLM